LGDSHSPKAVLIVYHKRRLESIAEGQAHREWTKANTTFIGLKLNNRTDADILAVLEGKAKQSEIKRLLRIALQSEKQ